MQAGAGLEGRTAVRWWMLLLLFALAFLAYVLRLNLSILADVIMPEFGLDELQMGWVFGAFTCGYAIFQLPGGLYGERVGPRRALTWIALLWGVVTLLTGILPGLLVASTAGVLVTLLAVRFVLGAVQAPIFPVQSGVVATWFPVGHWALPNSLLNMGLGLGAAVTPPLVAWLMLLVGWRATLFATAPLALVALLWWWYARDEPERHPKIGEMELSLISAGRGPRQPDAPLPQLLRRLFTNREVVLLTVAYFFQGYVFYIFFNWFFLYLVDVRGFGVLASGFLTSIPWVIGSIAAPIGGELCDRLCRRIGPRWGCRLPCLICMPVMGAFLVAGALAPDPYWAVAFLTLSFSFNLFSDGAYWAGMTYVGGRHTAAGCGIMNMGSNLGGVVSAPLMPLIAGWLGWSASLNSGAVVAILGAILWLWIRVDEPLETTRLDVPSPPPGPAPNPA